MPILAAFTLVPCPGFPLTPADSVRGGEIEQTWFKLTQTLDPFDKTTLRARCGELTTLADRTNLRRLTPFAMALVARARTLPP